MCLARDPEHGFLVNNDEQGGQRAKKRVSLVNASGTSARFTNIECAHLSSRPLDRLALPVFFVVHRSLGTRSRVDRKVSDPREEVHKHADRHHSREVRQS